jgi:SagB-type dehydrogenase family enzyme
MDQREPEPPAAIAARRSSVPPKRLRQTALPSEATAGYRSTMERDEHESATGTLHRLTSLIPERPWDKPADDPRVRQDIVSNDPEHRTPAVKSYASELPRTALPRELPVSAEAALAVLGGVSQVSQVSQMSQATASGSGSGPESESESEPGSEPEPGSGPEPEPAAAAATATTTTVNLATLSRLLFLSAGVVRTGQRDGLETLYRAAGSAGNRFPLDLYVAIPEIAGSDLPAGVHWYDAVEHALLRIAPPPADPHGAPTVIVTGIPWRTGWRYRERGFRHIYWDAGTMLSQLLALADSAGLAPSLFTRFPDAAVSELVGADRVHEWPVAVISLGEGAPSITATGPAVAGLTDANAVEFPLVTAAQHAGDLDDLGKPWDLATAATAAPTSSAKADSATLDQVITKRGSQRRMNPTRGLPLETLRTCMTVALRGIDLPHWIAVHDVTGLASGLYRWPDLDRPLREAKPEDMRAETRHVCLDQSLGHDAAFVVIAATDVAKLSDREYREAQLAAGIVEGRLHLAAYALDASATGMTFVDSEIPAFLGDPEAPHGLLFTCVGVPDNTSKPAGLPGAPTHIRPIRPRE